jgi:hypothetical protein
MHPKMNRPQNREKLHSFFVAFGTADPSVGTVSGRLKDAHGTTISQGETTRQPPNWVIVFKGVPIGKHYTLEIVADANESVLACSEGLEVIRMVFDVKVFWPPSGTPKICDDNFVPYGPYTGTGVVSATMTDSAGNVTNADSITQQGGTWYAQFTKLTPGTYELDVTQIQGQPDQRTGLGLIDCPK